MIWSMRLEDQPTVWRASPRDAPAVSALLYQFNGEALDPILLADRMAEVRGQETVFLAELDGGPAGLLVLRTVRTLSDPEALAEITELYVLPSARRRGVGRALVGVALQHAHQRGCTHVHLLVDPENQSAMAFYEALGFHRDSWEMRRTL